MGIDADRGRQLIRRERRVGGRASMRFWKGSKHSKLVKEIKFG